MLEIQKYLLEHGEASSFEYFKNELSLMVKDAADGKRVLFKYNQIDSPMGNPIVQEARGLILDRSREWRIVSWPFKKFFNYGEGHAAPLDLATAHVLEKVDGTCITLYHWEDRWRTQTLGMIDADGMVNNAFPPVTFAELFRRVINNDRLEAVLFPSLTYTFELATPFNRIVTRYEKERVVLLSVRNLTNLHSVCNYSARTPDPTFGEYHINSEAFQHEYRALSLIIPQLELPKIYSVGVTSLTDVAEMSKQLPQMEEGYVVVDSQFNRVKVKNPSYLALLHLKESSSSSVKALVQLVITNEGSEFLAYFPEFQEQYDRISAAISNLKDKLHAAYEAAKGLENQKDFALAIKASGVPFTGVLFALRKGLYKSIEEGLSNSEPKHIVELLKLEAAGGAESQGD